MLLIFIFMAIGITIVVNLLMTAIGSAREKKFNGDMFLVMNVVNGISNVMVVILEYIILDLTGIL